jgi:hypothetical protein
LDGPLCIDWIACTMWLCRELCIAVFAGSEHWNILHSLNDSLNDSEITFHAPSFTQARSD